MEGGGGCSGAPNSSRCLPDHSSSAQDQPLGILSPLATVTFVDDLLHKNQQLNMQVACLNQELAQLKKLEEIVALLHESQRQDWVHLADFWKQIFTFLYLLCFTWQVSIYILFKLTLFCVQTTCIQASLLRDQNTAFQSTPVSDSADLGWELRICISSKFPGDALASWPRDHTLRTLRYISLVMLYFRVT